MNRRIAKKVWKGYGQRRYRYSTLVSAMKKRPDLYRVAVARWQWQCVLAEVVSVMAVICTDPEKKAWFKGVRVDDVIYSRGSLGQ